MALKDVIGYTQAARQGPLEILEQKKLAAQARELEDIKTRSEAFYKTELGRSEIADRGADAKSMARMQKAMSEAPKRENYINPSSPAGEQKQALQSWWRDYSTFMTSNYPDIAKSLDMKPAQTGGAVAEVDVTAKQEGTEAETRRDIGEARTFESGLGAKGTTPTDSMLWEAENFLKDAGQGSLWGFGSPSAADVQQLATYAQQLQQADAASGAPPKPAGVYMQQAYDQIKGVSAQPQQAPQQGMPQAPPPQPKPQPTLREIDLTKPGMMR